jgi:glycosyltransferase involved in cell wall biosynthesis
MSITIAVTTFNRLKYAKSLFKSLENVKSNNQLIVVDNCSTEKGLQDYLFDLKKSNLIDDLFLRDPKERNWVNDEYVAKNMIIETAKNDVILFLQDDLQLIVNNEVFEKTVQDFISFDEAKALEVNAVRNSTVSNRYDADNCEVFKLENYKYYKPIDNHFPTMGFFKKEVFDLIGKYPVDWPQIQDYWGRSEDWYDNEVKLKLKDQTNYSSWVPLFAPVWNDPRGGYAFIRGNKRYGYYLDAPSTSGMYYEKLSDEQYQQKQNSRIPLGFTDVCKSDGWEYKVVNKDQVKYPQNKILLEGPEEEF